MTFDLPSMITALRRTIENPRAAARWILALNLPLGTASMALAAVAIVSAIVSAFISAITLAMGGGGPMAVISPWGWALLQLIGMFMGAALMAYAGRAFGGRGDLPGAMALLAWAQWVGLLLQLAQVLAFFILPPLVPLLWLLTLALTFWLAVNFIAELHGFESLIKVFFGLVGVLFAVAFAVATLFGAALGGFVPAPAL